jgi:hypothetical protein
MSTGSKFETLDVQLTETLMPKDVELVTGQLMQNMGWCWLYQGWHHGMLLAICSCNAPASR